MGSTVLSFFDVMDDLSIFYVVFFEWVDVYYKDYDLLWPGNVDYRDPIILEVTDRFV